MQRILWLDRALKHDDVCDYFLTAPQFDELRNRWQTLGGVSDEQLGEIEEMLESLDVVEQICDRFERLDAHLGFQSDGDPGEPPRSSGPLTGANENRHPESILKSAEEIWRRLRESDRKS